MSKLFPWQSVLDILRQHYTYIIQAEKENDVKGAAKLRSNEDIKDLRGHLLDVMKLTAAKSLPPESVQALVRYIHDCADPLQLRGM